METWTAAAARLEQVEREQEAVLASVSGVEERFAGDFATRDQLGLTSRGDHSAGAFLAASQNLSRILCRGGYRHTSVRMKMPAAAQQTQTR